MKTIFMLVLIGWLGVINLNQPDLIQSPPANHVASVTLSVHLSTFSCQAKSSQPSFTPFTFSSSYTAQCSGRAHQKSTLHHCRMFKNSLHPIPTTSVYTSQVDFCSATPSPIIFVHLERSISWSILKNIFARSPEVGLAAEQFSLLFL